MKAIAIIEAEFDWIEGRIRYQRLSSRESLGLNG